MSKVASDLVRMRRILTGEGRDNRESTLRAERDNLSAERTEMVKALRSMCAEHGDDGWGDDSWLPDVILNHLTSKWKNHRCQLDFSGISSEDRAQPDRKFGRRSDPPPATEDDELLTGEDLRAISRAQDDVRSGRVFTTEQLIRELNEELDT